MSQKIIVLIIFIGLIPITSHSQKKWSLDECIEFANENSLVNKGREYSTLISKEDFQQSKRNFLPSINGGSSYSIGFGRYIDPNTNDIIETKSYSNGYSMGASVNLFNSFRQWNAVSQKRLMYESSKASQLNVKYELAFMVMDAYYQVLFKKGLLQVAEERKELSTLNYKMISSKVKLGLNAKADLYEIESAVSTDDLRITQAKNQVEESILNLMQIMNLKGESINLIEKEESINQIMNLYTFNVASTYSKSLDFLPSIKSEELGLAAAEKGLAITRSNLYPHISMSAGLGTGFYQTRLDLNGNTIPFFDQIIDNSSKYIGLSMSIPISNKWSRRSDIKKTKIGILQVTNRLEQKKQDVYKEIQRIIQKNKALLAEKESSDANLKAKELAFTIAQKKFEKGILSIYELQQSKNQFSIAQIEKIRISLQLKYQKKSIDFYNGIPVFQFK